MRGVPVVRRLHLVLVVLSTVTAIGAIAQIGPPPPPPPLGPPPVPPGNPVTASKANLGKVLFWDEQLSSTRTVACGSCHQAERGGSDPRSRLDVPRAVNPGPDGAFGTDDDAIGSPGVPLADAGGAYEWSPSFGLGEQVTGRLANSHINAAYAPVLFWDGRAGRAFLDPVSGDTILFNGAALESQAAAPPTSSTEMGHTGRDWNDVAARVAASRPLVLATAVPADLAAWIGGRTYPQLFAEAFGTPAVTPARILFAIATYERTLFSNQTPFDSSLAGIAPLTPQETAGRNLFVALPCAGCHAGSLLSDNLFHYIGVRPATEDSGRAAVTGQPADVGAMRTPSLRNVALRASLMHGGRFHSIEEVIDFYDRGGDFNAPNRSPAIRPLNLTPLQKSQLAAFLRRPLTDPRVAAESPPFDHPSLYRESQLVPELTGAGVAGEGGVVPQPIAIEPPITGNPDFTVGVSAALGGAAAVLVIDDAEPALDGGIPASASFARLATTLDGTGAGAGYGSISLAIPDDPALEGRVLYGRWYVSDPGAAGGAAASPAFRFKIFGPSGSGALAVGRGAVAPTDARLLAGRPNPFARQMTIRFELTTATPVRIAVHDASGRLVRRLMDERSQPAGAYAIEWDGRGSDGTAVPPGVYFARLETRAGVASNRIVRVR